MKAQSLVCTVLSVLCWSILGTATSPSGLFKLTVLHTNDLHSRFDEVTASGSKCSPKAQCYGGVPRIKTAVQQIRNTHENTIFLNAGDFFQGTLWYSLLKWSVVSNMTRSLGYTASSLGNHEFDDGVVDLVKFATEVTPVYPLLACNLDFIEEPSLKTLIEPSRIFKIGTRSVGVIGYLTPETKDLASTGKVIFHDEIEKIQEEVIKLKSQGVDILIAVGHSGYDVDKEIAKKVDGIDIVVGGHTNSFLWSKSDWAEVGGIPAGPYPTKVVQKSGQTVLVVQTNGYGLYLGQMIVDFDSNGEIVDNHGSPLLLDKSIPKDPELDDMVAHYRKLIDSQMTNVVGFTSSYIDGGRPLCRLEECSFGNFMTDAMAAEMKVDIAVGNSGSIKGSFDQGNITLADIYTVVPYANNIDVVTMRGSTIKSMLEHSVSDYDPNHPDPKGWFLQVSGIIVTYDIRRPPTQRVVQLYKGKPDDRDAWVQVNDHDTYDVALPSYLAYGGDRFQMIPNEKTHHKNTGFLDKDLLISYLGKNNPLKFPAPGRIIIVTGNNQTTSSGDKLKKQRSSVFIMAWMVLHALELFIL